MKIAVIMGSMSDLTKVEPALTILKNFKIEVEVRCLSAHRTPIELANFIKESEDKGVDLFIAAAGMAAALPGVVASHTILPVIGLPIKGACLDGIDALLSMTQMPPGIPVATVAIDGAKNAAYLAIEILAIKYTDLKKLLLDERETMRNNVLKTNENINK